MATKPFNLTQAGVRALLESSIDAVPTTWQDHVTRKEGRTKTEPYAFLGALPIPREMVDGPRIQGLRSYNFNISDSKYELSFLIDNDVIDDDQTGEIRKRIAEVGQAVAIFKEYLFIQLLINGGGAGFTAYDGNTFFHDTRTQGASGTIDNKTTSAAVTGTIPTKTELLDAMAVIKGQMRRFNDDQGRPGNVMAMTQLRLLIPPEYDRAAREAFQSTLIDNTDNVYGRGLAQLDVSDYLTATNKMYVHAVGAPMSRGFVLQDRNMSDGVAGLNVQVYDEPRELMRNGGLLVRLTERFKFTYGEFRRCVEHTWS